jgi:hypothetical protein
MRDATRRSLVAEAADPNYDRSVLGRTPWLLLAALAGCSSTNPGAGRDLGGVEDGGPTDLGLRPEDAAPGDAALPDAVSAAGDAGADAAIAAGGEDAARDSGTDAGADGGSTEDSGPRWCDQQPGARLCADFDQGPAASAFDQTFQLGTMLGVDTSTFTSAPRSLLVSAAAGTTQGVGLLRHYTPVRTPTVSCTFDLRVDAVGSTDAIATVFDLQYNGLTSNDFYDLLLNIGQNGAALVEQNASNGANSVALSHTPLAEPALGRWVHAEVDVITAPLRATIKIDGVTAIDRLRLNPLANTDSGLSNVNVGLAFMAPAATGAWAVRLDSVLCF